MRITVSGANGATGRLLTEQALAVGHDVAAATRRPADFPITHERLSAMEADAHDGQAVSPAVKAARASWAKSRWTT
jgi:putative NADH-flavin reductase